MTHYRPSDAICHWRHLFVIPTAADVKGIVVEDEDVIPQTRINLVAACQAFTKDVIDYSNGMCWMQSDIFWYPGTWTLGHIYPFIEEDSYVTGADEVEEGCAAVGMRAATYDSTMFLAPAEAYCGSCASGLSFGDPVSRTYYAWVAYAPEGLQGGSFSPADEVAYYRAVIHHEFGHTMDFYFDEDGLGQTMPHPDAQSSYEHLNGDEWSLTNGDTNPDFLRAMFTGDVRDKATHTAQGATAEVWALGPPRKNYPR